MTAPPHNTTMEAFPMPDGAIQLATQPPELTCRGAVIKALQQVLNTRQLTLPLGPETALFDDQSLLQLNRFAVQLITAGMLADELDLDLGPWRTDGSAPQLCLAALVDQENDVVAIQGVCTNQEIHELAHQRDRSASQLTLETSDFRGGLERLLSLVQLLEPSAIPRQAFSTPMEQIRQRVINISDWIQGRLDDALVASGASLQPLTAGAFRADQQQLPIDAQALLSIPLGLDAANTIVLGDAVTNCIEQFQLQLLPQGSSDAVSTLLVRLCGSLSGDLLPDGLAVSCRQGLSVQRQEASGDLSLELQLRSSNDVVELAVSFSGGEPFALPPLKIK